MVLFSGDGGSPIRRDKELLAWSANLPWVFLPHSAMSGTL